MWKAEFDIQKITELRCKTHLFLGVGAIEKIHDIVRELSEKGIKRIGIVTSKSAYIKTGAWNFVKAALIENKIDFHLYDGAQPNPTDIQVDTAVGLFKKQDVQAIIGIGGGSPIDVAKSAAILMKYNHSCRDLYEGKFIPTMAVPIIAVNTTHGTGTEVNRFAVVSIEGTNHKPAIAYDCIYPLYAIDDPKLTAFLPNDQTIYVSLDAVNHVVEAATSVVSSPYVIMLARETINLVDTYLPRVISNPSDLEARYFLLYASAIAGICFDNGLLHYTHALEHPLSGVKPELPHGLGLAILLPAVIREIYPFVSKQIRDIFSCVLKRENTAWESSQEVSKTIERWLVKMGVPEKLTDIGFSSDDIKKLVDLVYSTPGLGGLVLLAPCEHNDMESVQRIFENSLVPLN